MISIGIVEGRPALEALAPEWEALAGNTFTSVFSQPAWYMAWLDAFQTRGVAAVTARDDGKLVGLLPMARFRTDARGMYFTQVAPFARGDYQPPLIEPSFLAELLPRMLDAAAKHFGRYGVYWLPNIPETDPCVPVLREYLQSREMPWVETREGAPRLRLDGRDYATVEKDFSQKHRADLRRRMKRLETEKGEVSLWVPSSVEEAEPVLSEFFRVHDEKWLSQGFPGMFQTPAQQAHFRAMLRHLWGKGVHFSTVRCAGIDISFQFGFLSGNWLQWYRPSYRTEYHVYSPSKVHIGLVIAEACRQGWNGLDFLLGDEEYKFSWTNERLEVINFHAGFHKWAPSYLWFSKGKPYVKERLAGHYVRLKAGLQKLRKSN